MVSFCLIFAVLGIFQLAASASLEDKYEPMVAFICERPAMHRTVNSWVPDRKVDCLEELEDILAYCQQMYPEHNVSNVVEASYLVTIPDWPMMNTDRALPHRVRPFRCLSGGFQSDALLVPQHCEFDHRHDQTKCEGFTHWNNVADDACRSKQQRLESFGMLLNCKLGHFSGVEYVCCPKDDTETTRYHAPQDNDKPDLWIKGSGEDDSSEATTSSSSSDSSDFKDDFNEDEIDLYEAYLRDQPFPAKYDNEHKKFLVAKAWMKKDQQRKVTKLLQDWQEAREHVDEVRKTDPASADRLSKEITERFQNLYSAYEEEHTSEREQLVALHLQRVQALLNERKRDTMDKYITALDEGDEDEIVWALHAYIKAEEKDRIHTVNHYEHVRFQSAREAARVHPFIVNHLKLTEQRIDQALEMLSRYPEIEAHLKPEIDEFMSQFNAIAKSIRDVVIPEPEVDEEDESLSDEDEDLDSDSDISYDESDMDDDEDDEDEDEDDVSDDVVPDNGEDDEEDDEDEIEDEHDYEKDPSYARRMQDVHNVKQGVHHRSVRSGQVGSVIGFALGGVSVFVIVVVAIVMVIRHRNNTQFVSHSYVEVDPAASPEERHLANMQMNGYENPTYMYFEQQPQNNPKA